IVLHVRYAVVHVGEVRGGIVDHGLYSRRHAGAILLVQNGRNVLAGEDEVRISAGRRVRQSLLPGQAAVALAAYSVVDERIVATVGRWPDDSRLIAPITLREG